MKYNIKLINQKIDNDIEELKQIISRQDFFQMSIMERVQVRLNRKKEDGE
jgi:hypothetical protein